MLSSLALRCVIAVFLLFGVVVKYASANSEEAGHCDPGDLSKKSAGHGETGSGVLSNGSIQVKFDSKPLQTSTTLNADKEYTVKLESTSSDFRGFLVRLSGVKDGVSAEGVLSVEGSDAENVKKLSYCASNVSGMSHNHPRPKSSVSFNFDYVGDPGVDLLLEVTVVQSRAENKWFYSAFNLNIVDPVSSPISAPISVPVAAPVVAPVVAPVAAPVTQTESPTKSGGHKWQLSSWTSIQTLAIGAAAIFGVMYF